MKQLMKVFRRIARTAGPLGKTALELFEKEEWAKLQQLRCEPTDYQDAEAYFRDAMCVNLFRKCKLPSGVDTEKAAKADFIVSEHQCARTNAWFTNDFDHLVDDERDAVFEILRVWRKDVRWVLGALPMEVDFLFSQGATLNDRGKLTTAPDKMSGRPSIYSDSLDVIKPFWHQTSWARSLEKERPYCMEPEVKPGNRFFTVPKDGKTDRGCAVEASLNVSAQLGVARVMRRRLRRLSIDIEHAQDKHRLLARRASRDGSLATIDMSRASDTVARLLVKAVLPGDWYDLLNALRAKHTMCDGKRLYLEKFSSMGNGFTFELETLLFASLARSVCRLMGEDPNAVSAFGDDLIVPGRASENVLWALRMFGFTPNPTKTFAKGPFRESCGGDYFDGVPVRAHFLKELPNEPQHWMALANGIRRVGLASGSPGSRWDWLLPAWLAVLDAIPSDLRRLRGPVELGDIVVHDVESAWSLSNSRSHVRAYCPIPLVLPWSHWSPLVQLASCTLGYRSEGVTPRGGVEGFRKKLVPLPSPDPRRLVYGHIH